MPTVLRVGPYRFAFFANESVEPPHVHIYAAEHEPKYWLIPIALAGNKGLPLRRACYDRADYCRTPAADPGEVV